MKIFLAGDIGGYNDVTNKIFNNINKDSSDNDILIILGDNFYPFGVTNKNDKIWNKYEKLNIKLKTYCILGNHDYLGNINAQINYKKNNWNMDNYYYKKTIEHYDFFFIDTSILVPDYSNLNYNIVKSKINKEPLEESKNIIKWLSKELKNSNNTKIVVGHYPIVSFGMYGLNKKLFEILFPVFSKYNVKIYISGHDHNLQIVDVASKGYSFKQLISGASSSLYPILKNVSSKVFHRNGYIYINSDTDAINIVDSDNNLICRDSLF